MTESKPMEFVRRAASSTWLMALVLALLLGVLVNWGAPLLGYVAGIGDHQVLSPQGIQWANPNAFVGDWFMEASPQPHWFFDIVTYLGALVGRISIAYFLFWCGGLIAFGFATAILARHWTPRTRWIAGVAFTLVASQTPWSIVGTGSPMISMALPAVTGGFLVYLFVAALITSRRMLTAILGPVVAIVHVQQGSVVLIILLVVLAIELIRDRRVDWTLLIGAGATAAFVIFGLVLRPVAANLSDFVEVCNTVIPYHCAAHTWAVTKIFGGIGLIALSALTVFFVARRERIFWLAGVALPGLGLLLGMLSDFFQIPVVGELAQATNVYRLAALVLPFGVWGILYPLLKPEWSRRYALIVGVWVVSFGLFLVDPSWYQVYAKNPVFLLGILVCAGFVVLGARYLGSRYSGEFITGIGALALGTLFVLMTAVGGQLIARPLTITFTPDAYIRQWGRSVERIVPVGEQLVAPPMSSWVKLATERGVVADCKDVPYGGTAWKQWNERLTDLGGVLQCVGDHPAQFGALDGPQLVALADKYKSHYIVLDGSAPDQITELQDLGWKKVVKPVGDITAVLMKSPDA
ncbi:DUF6798 domain-containing protein [Microbacterium sp. X-17]|uniref:DUF6798 domain-containing protein n=1 Tax=Microbacterium sp. X-17 TaxID=3144404 RepID=UPI0031F5870B